MNGRQWLCLALLVLMCSARAHAAENPGVALAERYGLSNWDQVEQISFTFNVKPPNRDQPIARQWSWSPGSGDVTRNVDGEAVSFNLRHVGEDDAQAHGQFINDSYWFLFPYQLVWSNPTVTDAGSQPLPMGDGEATSKLICQWPGEGGYTPGDAYDLYLGEDGLIQQWVFRRGGKPEGNAHTWEDHRQLGPIVVALDHRNADGTFRLWFTDVSATLADGTGVTPTPMDEP